MKIGYARVSTKEQNLARQLEAIEAEGCDKIYSDKISGKDFERPQYQKGKYKSSGYATSRYNSRENKRFDRYFHRRSCFADTFLRCELREGTHKGTAARRD